MKNVTYINAGAGSGKTYSLTERLLDLVKSGKCNMSEVILTTFTKDAAADFKEKTREKFIQNGLTAQAASIDNACIGTVHSVGFRYIKKYWYKLGLSASVDAIDDVLKDVFINRNLEGIVSSADIDMFHRHAEKYGIKIFMKSKIDYDFWKGDVKDIIEKADSFSIDNINPSTLQKSKSLIAAFATAEQGSIEPVCTRIIEIADELRGKFADYKREHSLIEYNDMERYFLALLEDDEVRSEIKDSIKYLFVDEFQDSNPTQLRIFDKLSELVERSFWVGDAKQSIYGFRGCDTALVRAVTGYIRNNAVKDWETKGGFGYMVLENSWRSVKSLVDLSNKVFPKVLQMEPDEVELKAKRKDFTSTSMYHLLFQPRPNSDNGKGYSSDDVARINELAHFVRNILDGKSEIKVVVDKKTNEKRPIKASDIAILAVKNSQADSLIETFCACGIPVKREIVVNASFREVRLLLCLLYYIILESNLLRAEIEHLLWNESLSDILTQKKSFDTLFQELDELKEKLQYSPVSEVVRTLILRLHLDTLCAKWGNWEERFSHLQALIACAEEYENAQLNEGNCATVQGFINYVSDDNCKSVICADGVTIDTYHSSKGLEWYLVILYSLTNDVRRTAPQRYLNPNAERMSAPVAGNFYSNYVIRYMTQSTSDVRGSVAASPAYNIDLNNLIAEKNRLLYVGVTRARDYLITCSFDEPKKLKWLADAGITPVFNANGVDIFGCGVPFKVIAQEYEEFSLAPTVSAIDVPASATPCNVTEEKFISPSKSDISIPVTATVLNGAIDVDRLAINQCGHSDAEIGTCLHAALALCRANANADNQKAIEEVICNYNMQKVFSDADAKAKIASIYDELCEVLKPYGEYVKEEHEVPFYFTSDRNERVKGNIDLLWHTDKGVVIVDFKSYRGGMSHFLKDDDAEYVGKYAAQLSLYRKAVEKVGLNVLGTVIYYAVQGRAVAVVTE